MKDLSGRKVYFARCIGPTGQPIGAYKIGCSYGHQDRLKAAAHNLPFTLELVAVTKGSMVMEAICHLHLKKFRISGEYFRECAETDEFIQRVAKTDKAFGFIRDSGYEAMPGNLAAPFMAFHGVTLPEVAKFLKLSVAYLERLKPGTKSRRLVAATALIANGRRQMVRWPDDITDALNAERQRLAA